MNYCCERAIYRADRTPSGDYVLYEWDPKGPLMQIASDERAGFGGGCVVSANYTVDGQPVSGTRLRRHVCDRPAPRVKPREF